MTIHRIRAFLELDKKKIPEVSSGAKLIYAGLSGKPGTYIACNPPLPILLQQITDLDTAQGIVKTTRGTVPARNAKRDTLWTSLESERMYVQWLSDQLPPEQGSAIILGAAMHVGLAGAHQKPIILCKLGVSGAVQVLVNVSLLANTYKNRTFYWQSTSDGGKSYNNFGAGPDPHITLTGLAPLTTIGFRAAVKGLEEPQADWTQTVYIVIK